MKRRNRQDHGVRQGALPVVLLLAFAALASCGRTSPEARAYAEAVRQARSQKDAVFRTESGPLTPAQRAAFDGLRYYAPDAGWAVEARLVADAASETVQFPTSNQTFDPYVKLGRLHFVLHGRPHELTLYRSLDGKQLFLPFSDRTSGQDTYGAGRYLDLELDPDGRTTLDFNAAYNPYCAYNASWVCPLAPAENILDVAVEAGEKSFPRER